MSANSDTDVKYYHYLPSLAGACVFAVLFGLVTLWHAVLIAKHRSWYMVPLLVGGIFELTGYAARGASNKQMPNLTLAPFVIQTLLLLVAPAFFAASIYMVLGRIILSVDGESYSLIRKRWLTKIFVTSDVITFFIQLGGGGLMASSKASSAKLGSHIVLAGLLLQIIIFGFFVVIALVFHRRMRAVVRTRSPTPIPLWEKYLYILYITSGFIMARSIVRVAEFIEGFEGEIFMHEAFLYIFDAVPMLAVMVIFNIWYPSKVSVKPRKSVVDREVVESDVALSNI